MTGQLTGYEETSVVEVGAVLDDTPATAEEVYLRTMAYSERAIAAVAAKRAGSGGANFNGGTITQPLVVDLDGVDVSGAEAFGETIFSGNDPDKSIVVLVAGPASDVEILNVQLEDGTALLGVDNKGRMNLYPIGSGGSGLSVDAPAVGGPDFGLLRVTVNGDQIFRVDKDGSVHIKTGTTIQADL